jgi:hypothetical protein
LDRREMKVGENCIMRSFITCTLHQVLVELFHTYLLPRGRVYPTVAQKRLCTLQYVLNSNLATQPRNPTMSVLAVTEHLRVKQRDAVIHSSNRNVPLDEKKLRGCTKDSLRVREEKETSYQTQTGISLE